MNVVGNVYRGGVVESSHIGHIAIVDAQGRLLTLTEIRFVKPSPARP